MTWSSEKQPPLQKKNGFRVPAGGESRASHPALQGLHQRNEHQHGPQHPPLRCVLRDRCQRRGGQGKLLLFLLLFIRCYYSVITGLLVCSERLPDSVPTAGANQAEVPQRIMGELGMDGVRLTHAEAPVLLVAAVTVLLLSSQICKAHMEKVSLSATGFFR